MKEITVYFQDWEPPDNPIIPFDEVVREWPQLHQSEAVDLHHRLCELRGIYDLNEAQKAAVTAPVVDTDRALVTFRSALRKVAALAHDSAGELDDPTTRRARDIRAALVAAGRVWGRERVRNGQGVPPTLVPVRHGDGRSVTDPVKANEEIYDYGTDITVEQFLSLATLLSEWADIAVNGGAEIRRRGWPSEMPPKVWLIGKELPQLYKATFGSEGSSTERYFDFANWALRVLKVKRDERGGDRTKKGQMPSAPENASEWTQGTLLNYQDRVRAFEAKLKQTAGK